MDARLHPEQLGRVGGAGAFGPCSMVKRLLFVCVDIALCGDEVKRRAREGEGRGALDFGARQSDGWSHQILRRCEMIEDRKLKPGTQLAARHKGREYRCEVVAGEGGKSSTVSQTAESSGARHD